VGLDRYSWMSRIRTEETNIWLKRKRKRKSAVAVLAVKIEPKRCKRNQEVSSWFFVSGRKEL